MRHRETPAYSFLIFCVFLCLYKQGLERKIGSNVLTGNCSIAAARAEVKEEGKEKGGGVVAQQLKMGLSSSLVCEVDSWVHKTNLVLDQPSPHLLSPSS